MNENQQQFMSSFKEWDAAGLGTALCAIFVEVLEEQYTPKLALHAHNEAASQLAGFLRHPRAMRHIEIDGMQCGLKLDTDYHYDPENGNVEIRLSLHRSMPDRCQQLWRDLDYTDEVLVIPRKELHPPIPLKTEEGWSPKRINAWQKKNTIKIKTPAHHNYAYARRQRSKTTSEWLTRCKAGECEAVWDEMVALGDFIRDSEKLGDAVSVSLETMRRSRQNIRTLEKHLPRLGYQFRKWRLPQGRDLTAKLQIHWLESKVGPLPLSICAWYDLVGSVNFAGLLDLTFDSVKSHELDPLFVFPTYIAFLPAALEWTGVRRLLLAPDEFGKIRREDGGSSYDIIVPDGAADAQLVSEWHNTTFVNYLRECFRYAGLPGLPVDYLPTEARSVFDEIVGLMLPI